MQTTVFFSHQNPTSPWSHQVTDANHSSHQMWIQLVDNEEYEADSLITEIMNITGFSRVEVNEGINAVWAMNRLPKLRSVQENFYHLNVRYLSAIMKAVAEADESIWASLDELIAEDLTPFVANEKMIQANTLVKRIKKWIKELDPTYAERKKAAESEDEYFEVNSKGGITYGRFKLVGGRGSMLKDVLREKARNAKNYAQAFVEFVEEKTKVSITKYLFTSKNSNLNWTPDGGDGSDLDLSNTVKEVDLDLQASEEDQYKPSERLKAIVKARDGHCRFPGCCVPVDRCQVDHIIPWDKGGPTALWNLQSVCQRHHNMKTDGRFTAEANSIAEVKWIGPLDVPVVTRPDGPLAATIPRGMWGQLLRDRMEARFEKIKERALRGV